MKTRDYILHTHHLAALLLLTAGCSNKEAVQAAKPSRRGARPHCHGRVAHHAG